jgi:uncharacterized protein (DUF302 family)
VPRELRIRRPVRVPAVASGATATGTAVSGSVAVGSMALGSAALGALAVGALAIGRLAIGRATVKDLRVRRLEIGELVLGRSGPGMGVVLDLPFDAAVARTRDALAEQGFGILSEIDVAATLREKLGVEMPPQLILGACNPSLAHRGLTIEPDLGLLLPCTVVVRSHGEGTTGVTALDPDVMVTVSGRAELGPVAAEARERLAAALERLRPGTETATPTGHGPTEPPAAG